MKYQPVFITATGTGAGKTYISRALIAYYAKQGLKVAPFKPIETGVINLPEDANALQLAARNCGNEFELDAICPVRFALPAAPAVAKGESAIDWSAIDAAFDRLRSLSDFVLIEGAGGSFAPIDDLFFSVDLANRYNAKTLLIVHDRLGMIHDLLTALEAVEKRLGVLPIWAVNTQNAAEFERISAPYLAQRFGGFYRLDNDFEIVADILIK